MATDIDYQALNTDSDRLWQLYYWESLGQGLRHEGLLHPQLKYCPELYELDPGELPPTVIVHGKWFYISVLKKDRSGRAQRQHLTPQQRGYWKADRGKNDIRSEARPRQDGGFVTGSKRRLTYNTYGNNRNDDRPTPWRMEEYQLNQAHVLCVVSGPDGATQESSLGLDELINYEGPDDIGLEDSGPGIRADPPSSPGDNGLARFLDSDEFSWREMLRSSDELGRIE